MHEMFVPKAIFFTNGVGVHKDRLSSFELALRNAGIEKANLVTVSSIFPPFCKEMSRKEGEGLIMPGQIVHCVMARQDTNEPNRLIAAAIGLARPADKHRYGYLSEQLAMGKRRRRRATTRRTCSDDLLATTLGSSSTRRRPERARVACSPGGKDILRRNIIANAEVT
jgi:arginine decarboxylase